MMIRRSLLLTVALHVSCCIHRGASLKRPWGSLVVVPKSHGVITTSSRVTGELLLEQLRGGSSTVEEEEKVDEEKKEEVEDESSEAAEEATDEAEEDADEEEAEDEEEEEDDDEEEEEYDDEDDEEVVADSVEVDESGDESAKEYDKMLVPSPATQLYSVLGVMMLSRRVDMYNPMVVRIGRFAFIAYIVILQLFLLFVRLQAKAVNDRTPVQIKNPLSKLLDGAAQGDGGSQVKNIASSLLTSQSTVLEYDLSQIKSMNGGLLVNMAFTWFLHYKMGQTQPLYLQVVQGFTNLVYSPLFQVYVLGRNLERPFSNPTLARVMEQRQKAAAAAAAAEAEDAAEDGDEDETAEAADEEEDDDEEDEEEEETAEEEEAGDDAGDNDEDGDDADAEGDGDEEDS